MKDSLTPHEWAERLRAQAPVRPDPSYPDRPRSGFFDLLSRIMRAVDDTAEDTELPALFALVGGDDQSLAYITVQRALRLLHSELASARIRREINASARMREDVIAMFCAAWIDGFVAGALYGNQNPVIGRMTLDEKENP